jgi:hypothetical protein
MMYIILSQIYFGITQYKLGKKNLFSIEFFVLWSIILCNFFGKICSKITMVEVQIWTPLENSEM